MRMTNERSGVLLASFSLSFAGLVVLARSLNPIPSRTRPLNSSAPMVLWLKPWESRSLPGLPRTKQFLFNDFTIKQNAASLRGGGVFSWGIPFEARGLWGPAISVSLACGKCGGRRGATQRPKFLRTDRADFPEYLRYPW